MQDHGRTSRPVRRSCLLLGEYDAFSSRSESLLVSLTAELAYHMVARAANVGRTGCTEQSVAAAPNAAFRPRRCPHLAQAHISSHPFTTPFQEPSGPLDHSSVHVQEFTGGMARFSDQLPSAPPSFRVWIPPSQPRPRFSGHR